ncbi:hypothetical protein QQP08_002570 [Theobroma cacao]|nr:hypothetical protein QQP08_002570 [Theobroma cacao]
MEPMMVTTGLEEENDDDVVEVTSQGKCCKNHPNLANVYREKIIILKLMPNIACFASQIVRKEAFANK